MKLTKNRTLEIILAGRMGIDFNTCQLNKPFSQIESFTKSVGGSPANIAQGTAKLGLKTGFVGKVAGDGMGTYILDVFKMAGINVEGIILDNTGARNCLAITEIKSPQNSGSYLYRENTADLLISSEEIKEAYIKSSSAVLISGTAFSQSPSREAMQTVIDYAKRNGTLVMLDIDYRPFGWKNIEEASEYYQMVAKQCDVIIGNREEFNILEYISMPDNRDNSLSAKSFISSGTKLVIVKDGVNGSVAFTDEGETVFCGVIPTQINKTFGSGDAFAAGLLYGLFRDLTLSESMQLGSACASIVLMGISCADALPTIEQATQYLLTNPVKPYLGGAI